MEFILIKWRHWSSELWKSNKDVHFQAQLFTKRAKTRRLITRVT